MELHDFKHFADTEMPLIKSQADRFREDYDTVLIKMKKEQEEKLEMQAKLNKNMEVTVQLRGYVLKHTTLIDT